MMSLRQVSLKYILWITHSNILSYNLHVICLLQFHKKKKICLKDKVQRALIVVSLFYKIKRNFLTLFFRFINNFFLCQSESVAV